jgi:hypothetical protein
MKKMMIFGLMLGSVIGSAAMAQEKTEKSEKPAISAIRSGGEIEASCRVRAKEIAADTYRGCVTEQKNAQIEQIKKDYQAKIKALKSHYESELKKVSGKRMAVNEAAAPEATAEKTTTPEKSSTGEKPERTEKEKTEKTEKTGIDVSDAQATPEKAQPSSDDALVAAPAAAVAPTQTEAAPEVQTTEVKPSEIKAEPSTEVVTEPKAEAKPETKAATESTSDIKASVKETPKKEDSAKDLNKAEPKIELKADKKAEIKTETKTAIKAIKVEKLKTGKVEGKAEVKAEKAPAKKPTTSTATKALPVKPVQKAPSKIVMGPKAPKKAKITEMTVRLKPATVTPSKDESTMDMPEPIPLENVSSKSSI